MKKLLLTLLTLTLAFALVSCNDKPIDECPTPPITEGAPIQSERVVEFILKPFHLDFSKYSLENVEGYVDKYYKLSFPVYRNDYPIYDAGIAYDVTPELKADIIESFKKYLALAIPDKSFSAEELPFDEKFIWKAHLSYDGLEFFATINDISISGDFSGYENILDIPYVKAGLDYLGIKEPQVCAYSEKQAPNTVHTIYKITENASIPYEIDKKIINDNFRYIEVKDTDINIVNKRYEEINKEQYLGYEGLLSHLYDRFPEYKGKEIKTQIHYNNTIDTGYYIPTIRFYVEGEENLYTEIDVIYNQAFEHTTVFGTLSGTDNVKLIDDNGNEYNVKLFFDVPSLQEGRYKVSGMLSKDTDTLYVDDYYGFTHIESNAHTDSFDFEYEIKSTTIDELFQLSPEEKAKEFLSAICLKNREIIDWYFWGNSYDEFLKADVDATIIGISNPDIPGVDAEVDVLLKVENSETEIFPNGESFFTLIIGESELGQVLYFGKSENKDYYYQGYAGTEYASEIPEEFKKAQRLAEVYSSYISTDKNVSKMTLDELISGGNIFNKIFHAMIHYFPKGMEVDGEFNYYATTSEAFLDCLKTTLGYGDDVLKMFEDEFNYKYPADENGISYVECAHGNNYVAKALSDFKEVDGKIYLTYELFADSIFALKSQELTFVFEKLDDALSIVDVTSKKLNDYEVFGHSF